MDAVYRAAMAMSGDRSVADDLVQAAFLKAWQRFDRFEPGSNCRAWLLRILRNTWIDRLRQRRPVDLMGPEGLDHAAAPPDVPDPPAPQDRQGWLERLDDELLVRALGELPEQWRLALFLVDVEGYSQQEAAEVLEVAVGTVKSRTSRARGLLRRRLEEFGRNPPPDVPDRRDARSGGGGEL